MFVLGFENIGILTDDICIFVIIALLSFSIYRIRKYSKMLEQSKIFANECLMVSHLTAFIYLGVVMVIANCFLVYWPNNYPIEDDHD